MIRRRILKTRQHIERVSHSNRSSHHLRSPTEASGSRLSLSHANSSRHELRSSASRESHLLNTLRSPLPTAIPQVVVHPPPSSSVEHTDVNLSDDDSDSDFDDYGFNHPSTYADQPWIWLPKDDLGLSDLLVTELRDGGVDASDEGSYMDRYGNVEVSRSPPEEPWAGGQDK